MIKQTTELPAWFEQYARILFERALQVVALDSPAQLDKREELFGTRQSVEDILAHAIRNTHTHAANAAKVKLELQEAKLPGVVNQKPHTVPCRIVPQDALRNVLLGVHEEWCGLTGNPPFDSTIGYLTELAAHGNPDGRVARGTVRPKKGTGRTTARMIFAYVTGFGPVTNTKERDAVRKCLEDLCAEDRQSLLSLSTRTKDLFEKNGGQDHVLSAVESKDKHKNMQWVAITTAQSLRPPR